MSDLVERLRKQLTRSMFAARDDLYGQMHDERGQAADRIEQLERVLAQAREAFSLLLLETEDDVRVFRQTTRNARQSIAAIDEALK